MVNIKSGKGYEYKYKAHESILIDKRIREDMSKLAKEKKINKSKLIEEFYKTILLRFREGSLNASDGYITLNILREPICKSK
jgi:hypothetical protein